MTTPSIPLSVAEWTLDTVRRVVAENPHEPDWLDYKEALVPHKDLPPEKKDEHRNSIRRCACAMANTNGGFIVFGVKDKKDDPDARLVGLDLTTDLRKQFGDLLDAIDPNIREFDARSIPFAEGDKGVWVVQIPVSPLRPHMLDGRFYKREAAGKNKTMSAHEVRDAIMLRETQVKKLELLLLAFKTMTETLERVRNAVGTWYALAVRFNVDTFRLLVGEMARLLPPDLLRDLLDASDLAECVNRRLDWAQQAYTARGRNPDTTQKETVDLANTLSAAKPVLERLVNSLTSGRRTDEG